MMNQYQAFRQTWIDTSGGYGSCLGNYYSQRFYLRLCWQAVRPGGGEDLTSLKAEVAALKQEVEALKQQLADSPASAGSSDQSGSDASPAASEASYNLGQPFQYDGVEFTITERERTTQIHDQIVAAEGYEFLLYNITLHNAGSEDYSYSQNDYSIVLSNGEFRTTI